MSNHYHVVLKINHELARDLSDEEVIGRWTSLFSMPLLIKKHLDKQYDGDYEFEKAKEIIQQWRERLADLSWFMRCLNEFIAHKANQEDKCTGRFWEGRFKSQALLNEQALLSCMAYVDLNPIRAGLVESLDESEFTSIEQRIKETVDSKKTEKQSLVVSQQSLEKSRKTNSKTPKEAPFINLADFVGGKDVDGIPYRFMDYLELVDWTGRAVLENKRGYIPEAEPRILDKLGFTAEIWLQSVNQFSDHLYSHIGSPEQLKAVCEQKEQKWIAGIKQSRQFYAS